MNWFGFILLNIWNKVNICMRITGFYPARHVV